MAKEGSALHVYEDVEGLLEIAIVGTVHRAIELVAHKAHFAQLGHGASLLLLLALPLFFTAPILALSYTSPLRTILIREA